jgi:hypothetical protein
MTHRKSNRFTTRSDVPRALSNIAYAHRSTGLLPCENTGAIYLWSVLALLARVTAWPKWRQGHRKANKQQLSKCIPSTTWCQQNSFAVACCWKIRDAKYSFLLRRCVCHPFNELQNLQGGTAETLARGNISLAHAIHCCPIFFYFFCPTK